MVVPFWRQKGVYMEKYITLILLLIQTVYTVLTYYNKQS